MDLTLVIVNWNSGPALERLLESVSVILPEIRAAFVIDNASTDSSLEVGDSYLSRGVSVVRFKKNLGFAVAANRGIELSETELVLLLNPDIRVNANSVKKLYGEAKRRPEISILTCALVGTGRRTQEAFQIRSLPSVVSVISDALFLDEIASFFSGGRTGGSRKRKDLVEPDPRSVDQPAAAFWMLRKSVWRELGGFDESFYPAWYEDVDFCKRLKQKGGKILFFPGLTVEHEGGVSLQQLDYSQFLDIYYGNLIRYWKKHHGRTVPIIWLPVKLGVWIRKLLFRR